MKILLLSLLRLGDIVMHRQVVRNLKRQYPGCQVHMLIHSQFQTVQSLLPEVDQWHALDRNEIQKILVERAQSPIAAFETLQRTIESLNSQNFDLVFNLTHNRFSVRLMDLIQAKEKRGVALEMGRKVADMNSWQTYLNENFSELKGSRFHYLEVLQKSLGIQVGVPSVAGQRQSRLVLIQLLTSDVKKNWGLGRFKELKHKLEREFPEARIVAICSPQEKEQVSKFFDWNEFVTPTLDEVALLLNEAALLITGDTSIQHLAAQQGCPVVSLFLGSADAFKTAPWQEGAWVVQGQAACAPCAHSSPCHQATHLCADALKVETVFSLVSGVLRGKKIKIFDSSISRTSSHKNSSSLEKEGGFAQWLEKEVWTQYLDGSQVCDVPEVDPVAVQELKYRQARFEKAVQAAKLGNMSLSEVERSFPEWSDSLIRWKRDSQFTQEVEAICKIRREILDSININMEKQNVRSERSASQNRFAEA